VREVLGIMVAEAEVTRDYPVKPTSQFDLDTLPKDASSPATWMPLEKRARYSKARSRPSG